MVQKSFLAICFIFFSVVSFAQLSTVPKHYENVNEPKRAAELPPNKNRVDHFHNEKFNQEMNQQQFEQQQMEQQQMEEEKNFLPIPTPPPKKDVIEDIKTPHGETIIQKVEDKKKITTLKMETKRVNGLQMPDQVEPAKAQVYTSDSVDFHPNTGIHSPLGEDNQNIQAEPYIPSDRPSRY